MMPPSISHMRKLLAPWGLADQDVEAAGQGADNATFVVGRGDNRRILRCYGVTKGDEVEFELDLIDLLVDARFPTPAVVPTWDGRRAVNEDGITAAVFEFVDGDILDPGMARAGDLVARMTAELHRITEGRAPRGYRSRTDAGRLQQFLHACAHDEVFAYKHGVERFRREVEMLAEELALLRGVVPSGALHHDLHWGNILVAGGRIVAVIDFDEAYAGPFVIDIASLLHYWAHGPDAHALDCDKAGALLRAYAQVRPIGDMERRVLPLALRVFYAADAAEWILRRHAKRSAEFELAECRSVAGYYELVANTDWAFLEDF